MLARMHDPTAPLPILMTLYTDASVVRGTVLSRRRRITDVLNDAEQAFVVLHDVRMDDFGTHEATLRAEYAQINLASVLFAVATDPVEPVPELRTLKVIERALISIPPFRVTGRIHLLPQRDLSIALGELTGRFLPVTEATYWSEPIGEARTEAPMLAVNHARAQILAPFHESDPWVGLRPGGDAVSPGEPQPEPEAWPGSGLRRRLGGSELGGGGAS